MNLHATGVLADRVALNAILRRAVTLTNGHMSPYVDDDLRMLRNVGVRFLGRSAYVWRTQVDDDGHFASAKAWANRIHDEVSPDTVLQAGIFEAIFPQIDEISVPAWVFEDLGEVAETRTFSYEAMRGDLPLPGRNTYVWRDGGAVPDLTRAESVRWFYYRARRYLESGYEALHLGQAHLVGGFDHGYRQLARLCQAIRLAAARHARRGWVLLDAHSHGIAIDGELLFDFASRPLSQRALVDYPEQIALIKRGESIGGRHPGGWTCDHAPTLVEVDNWGGYSLAPDSEEWPDLNHRARAGLWGYDQISWFARLPDEARRAFLRYAHRWTRLQGAEWYFQPVLTRSFGQADFAYGGRSPQHYYRANRIEECPEGFGDEDVIAAIWNDEDPGRYLDPPPAPAVASASSLTIPEPVTVVGQLQPLLGGVPGDASCPWSRLFHIGEGRFARTFAIPLAGRYAFTITNGGTMTDPANQGGVAMAQPWMMNLSEPGTLVRIEFDFDRRTVAATNVLTGESQLA